MDARLTPARRRASAWADIGQRGAQIILLAITALLTLEDTL